MTKGSSAVLPPGVHLLATLMPLLIAASLLAAVATCRADTRSGSRVDRPAERGPIFLTASGSFGGTIDYDPGCWGFAAGFVFRPLAAGDFIDILYRWNAAMVLQAEYRGVAGDRDLLSADFILRWYEDDMRSAVRGGSTFWGLGLGATRGTYPLGGTTSAEKGFTLLLEVGYEWSRGYDYMLFSKVQLRYFDHGGLDYNGWSVHCGAGLPIFW